MQIAAVDSAAHILSVATMIVIITVYTQAPQTGIKPHTDDTNFVLTAHLGLGKMLYIYAIYCYIYICIILSMLNTLSYPLVIQPVSIHDALLSLQQK